MDVRPLPLNANGTWQPVQQVPEARQLQAVSGTPEALQHLESQLEMRSKWVRLTGAEQPTAATGQDLPPLNRMSERERFALESKPASELTEEQYNQLFGGEGWKLKELADKRGNLKVGDLTQLRGDNEGLEAVRSILLERPDLEMSDIVKRKRDGTTAVDPSLFHEQSRKLLTTRPDIKPLELTHMGASFASWLRNPAMAHEAYLSAIDLMNTRGNIRPKELEGMMGSMVQAVGGPGKAQTQKGGASVVDMFKSGAQLLKKRPDLRPHDVSEMAKETGKLAGKQAGDEGPPLVAQAFKAGARALERSQTLQVDDVIGASKVMRKHFPGEDAKATQDRVRGFEMGVDLMADHPGIKPGHLDQMLANAKRQQPGMQGPKLLNALDGMTKGVANGTASLDALTDPKGKANAPGGMKIDKFGQTQAVDQLGGQNAPRPPAAQRGPARQGREGAREARQPRPETPRGQKPGQGPG